MAKIHAGYSELRNAYKQHKRAARERNEPAEKLLYFYAVECGLKNVYLVRNRLRNTAEMPERLLSHDLWNLAKELRIPRSTLDSCPTQFRLHRDNNTNHPLANAHEAWRYGIIIRHADENSLVAWFDEIIEWLIGVI